LKNAHWFFKLREEFPKWKLIVWLLLGRKQVGEKDGVTVVGYKFRHTTLVWRIDSEDQFWRYPQ